MKNLKSEVVERFIKYVKIWTTSDAVKADEGVQPSTVRQFDLARVLVEEMKALKLCDVQITKNCYVYGYLNASDGFENAESFCLIAHLDTVGEVSGKNVCPNIIENYAGDCINLKCGVVLNPALDVDLALAAKENDTIITSDGTTLLGADDKAGIAEILTAIAYLREHPEIKHGKIEVVFSPDEETGHGTDNFPFELLCSKRAYTVDGGHLGELEDECFNAFKSEIVFTGHSVHSGTAKAGKMVNSISMASSFIANLPRHEAPETTEKKEGFYFPLEMVGSIEQSRISLYLRDFSMDVMRERMNFVELLAKTVAKAFGGSVNVTHTQQYLNMKQKMDESPNVVKDLYKAFEESGITPVNNPIRGGTDGSRLTELGIPTPNIFTGGHNFHSRNEWVSVSQMLACVKVLVKLSEIIGEN